MLKSCLIRAVALWSRQTTNIPLRSFASKHSRFDRLSEEEEEQVDWLDVTQQLPQLQGAQIRIPKNLDAQVRKWRQQELQPVTSTKARPRAARPFRPLEGVPPSIRQLRVAEMLKRELVDEQVFDYARDPRLTGVMIEDVHISRDLRVATIWWDMPTVNRKQEKEKIAAAEAALRGVRGLLRTRLADRVYLKVMPQLVFRYDSSEREAFTIIDRIARINKIEDADKADAALQKLVRNIKEGRE